MLKKKDFYIFSAINPKIRASCTDVEVLTVVILGTKSKVTGQVEEEL